MNIADQVYNAEETLDESVNVSHPFDWEFLGAAASCRAWDRQRAYRTGECARLPNGEVWCARRSVHPGETGPGETGWKIAWSPASSVLGADHAAEAAHAQRHHGRGGVMVGSDPAMDDMHAQRYHGRGGVMVGDDPVASAAESTRRIVERARDAKSPSLPPAAVTHYDADYIDVDPTTAEILGSAGVDETAFPVTTELYRAFAKKREPKYVRLDTEASYRDFRAEQSPEIAELRLKVEALEALVRAHTRDGHGAQDVIVGLASDVSKLQSSTADKRVPMQMPPWAEGTWDCWREDGPDGGLVCCSIALPGHDGEVRICTAATPVRKHVEDVVGYSHDVECDVVDLLGVLPTIACMLAGGSLMTEMAAAAPAVLAHPDARGDQPFIGKIVPANQPTLATLIALLQRAQAGDAQAAREWSALARVPNTDLSLSMGEAKRRLLAEQSDAWGR